jgi:DNA segregation ATPase FtsK/SpoIIIE, S-DNA-T family
MSVASAKPSPKLRRFRLSPAKGNELKGLLLLALGALLALSLVTYDPTDPSLLHQASGAEPPAGNWIGAVGAQIAALAFGLLGLTSLVVPLLLLVAATRRLRGRDGEKIVGRGLGALLLVATLPGLLQLTLGRISWRGGGLDAGGVLGSLAASALERQLAFGGALLVLLVAVVIASTLLVQSTLGEALAAWYARLWELGQRLGLAWSRTRERREKDRARQRIVARHLERARQEHRLAEPGGDGADAPPLDLPLRVVEKKGAGSFAIRRVAVPAAETAAGPFAGEVAPAAPRERRRSAPPPAAAAVPQQDLPFAAVPGRGDLPPINLLQMSDGAGAVDSNELVRLADVIRRRCGEFGVEGTVEGISPGPVITVFEFQPAPGIKVSQIVNLQDDLALALKAESVRIDRLPGRSTLGIEVPNRERQLIHLGPLLGHEGFRRSPSVLTLALGVTIHGEPFFADLATMPHLLVAGATGSGKSVGLQSMITSVLFKAHREQVQFIFIDPKRIELGVYADVPCLRTPVVVEPKQAANVLGHMVAEMESRYRRLAKVHVRSIAHYNHAIRDPEQRKRLALAEGEGEIDAEDLQPLPYYVIIIDELADLMMVASADVETAIARLAQMARAVGIHLIVATQRPSVDVLTGTIKANFPCRVSYATATRHDSRVILDHVGAEKLLGMGDMLFMPPGTSRVMRLHGAYVTEQETAALVRWLKKQGKPDYDLDLLEPPEENARGGGDTGAVDDDLYDEAARLVVAEGMASASFLQRRMRIGFSRASRLIDMMEREGLLGPPQGSKPREVLVDREYFRELDLARAEP